MPALLAEHLLVAGMVSALPTADSRLWAVRGGNAQVLACQTVHCVVMPVVQTCSRPCYSQTGTCVPLPRMTWLATLCTAW